MRKFWEDYSAYVMAILFTIAITWLNFRQYTTFQLNAPDVATFGQAIWNTLHGRFLYSTIIQRSILAYHFSPFLALLSPLLFIWNDIRILFVAQTIGLAVTGLLLYKIVHDERPSLAPWFLLAFYLNPALHEVALQELRRVIFAAPFLALALYGLHGRRYWLMGAGLFFALLCKEDISLAVFMMGVFLVVRRRAWQWGVPLIIVGLLWALIVPFCVIPSFHPAATRFSCTAAYPQLEYFSNLDTTVTETTNTEVAADDGFSLGGIVQTLTSDPLSLGQMLFDAPRRHALWRIFLPLGIILPFLAWDWLLMTVPVILLMLLSHRSDMYTLVDWYMAPVLPTLFAAVAVGVLKLPQRYQQWAIGLLLVTTLIGYRLYSGAPLGANYIPVRYEIIEHHRQAAAVLDMIPPDAAVAAQDAFLAHLTQRKTLYLYPWYNAENNPVDFVVLDRYSRQYPFDELGIGYEIDNQVADPQQVIAAEVDGVYLFAKHAEPHPAVMVNRIAEDSIKLERVEIAPADAQGHYQNDPLTAAVVTLQQGQWVRVTLYWEALAKPVGERTVSVRIQDATEALVGQQDMQPSQGARPTSWWEPGWYFRDVYYLEINPAAAVGMGELRVQLYDSYTQEIVPFGQDESLLIVPVEIRPRNS